MNRSRRKWLSTLLGMTLAGALLLSGCGTTGSATTGSGTTGSGTVATSATAASGASTTTAASNTSNTASAAPTASTGSNTTATTTATSTATTTTTTATTTAATSTTNPVSAPAAQTTAPTSATTPVVAAPAAPAGPVVAPAPASPWPMTVTDYKGRTVTIPAQPRRILSLAPSNTETLFALGLGSKVVGIDDYSDYPAETASVKKVGGLYNPNVELMVSLQPDLVLAIDGGQKQWQKLADQGVPVLVIQPATIAQVLESIRFIGKVTGSVDAAAQVTAHMQERIDFIQAQVARVHGNYSPTAFYEVWNDPIYTAGPGSFIDDMLRIAGASNVFHGTASAWPVVTLESVVAANPQVIISSSADWVNSLKAGKFPAWNGIQAVKDGNIYLVDANQVSRPGPRITEGLWQIARVVNPTLFD